MKKYTFIIIFIGILISFNTVKADTIPYTYMSSTSTPYLIKPLMDVSGNWTSTSVIKNSYYSYHCLQQDLSPHNASGGGLVTPNLPSGTVFNTLEQWDNTFRANNFVSCNLTIGYAGFGTGYSITNTGYSSAIYLYRTGSLSTPAPYQDTFNWTYSVGFDGFVNLDYSTILDIIPQSNTTIIPFVSTSTDRSATFDVDLLEYYTISTTTHINAYLQNNDVASFNYFTGLYQDTIGYSTTTFSIADNVPFGNYNLYIDIYDSDNNIITSTTSSNITFGSSTNAITFADIYGASSSNMFDISQIATSSECSITNITGCFKNAIVWAFYPDTNSMQTYQNFITLLKTKAPVGYFYIIKDSISDISATSTTTIFNVTIPQHLKDYIFNPLDSGIATLIWIFFIFMFFKRLRDIQL